MTFLHLPRATFTDGDSISIQVGSFAYCLPRNDSGPYHEVELGFPSFVPDETIMDYAEEPDNPKETVYGYVPIELVEEMIASKGGLEPTGDNLYICHKIGISENLVASEAVKAAKE
jgi:hypothetical protein